jgi:outer membrane lipoprotein carrier protein
MAVRRPARARPVPARAGALGLLAALLSALPAVAEGPAAPAEAKASAAEVKRGTSLAHRVQRFYGHSKDFSASFSQRYSHLALGRVEERTGTVQVKKPGLLRWEYQTPEKKLLLLDGKAFWQWVPEDNQVTVKRGVVEGELSAAFTFLWGKGDLLAEFAPQHLPLPEGMPQGEALLLLPRKEGGAVSRLLLVVDPHGQVLASQVTDGQGNENRLLFTGAKVDQSLSADLFVFAVPKGASLQELP